ncbi:MAG: hypothetical protein AMXMBFR45_15560 [Gammaproteobacteria bacterium]|nr:MAG: hypothetical protein EDM71_10405 [Pseudomonadota bacterium]MBC6945290.1 hypothetical protein [Gammaproteobacteria bacterium]MCE7901065.1 hypothetical protein [Gammaproteobacteria bacterium PRO9]MDL1880149.1 hypothetical protein [Gammaproteobacteria bacterium PRO2]MCL4776229.1 hypothetical protein [Gammaproteobacteria bacterium]
MGTATTPLLQRRQEPDEEQLLKLFWNRAELKKELARLRREKDKLIDQVRQQEAINLRAQQRLEQLEGLLADPVQAVNAVVYYQLRGVWQQCRKRLVRLARELAERQQDREERLAQQQCETVRDADLALIDNRIADVERRARMVQADLDAVETRLGELRAFWHYFRRRALRDQRAAIQAALDGLQRQGERIREERRSREAEPGLPFAGLSVEGRRNINLALIAMAQELLIQFSENDVAALAREASIRSLADVSYGDVAQCQKLGRSIEAVVSQAETAERMAGLIRRRAEFLRQTAQYRRDIDTIPVAGSFATVPVTIQESGAAKPAGSRVIPINVLAEEYWDVYSILLN